MNIKKELVNALKNLVGVYFGKVYTQEELKISDKSIGGKVEMVQPDGTLAPAQDGDYVMDDGFAFTVKDGLIESIVGQEQQPVEVVSGDTANQETQELSDVPVEDVAVEDTVATGSTDATIIELQDAIKSLDERIAAIESAVEGFKNQTLQSDKAIENFSKTVQELNSNIQTLAKVPVEFSKTNKAVTVEESKEEKLLAVAKILGRVK